MRLSSPDDNPTMWLPCTIICAVICTLLWRRRRAHSDKLPGMDQRGDSGGDNRWCAGEFNEHGVVKTSDSGGELCVTQRLHTVTSTATKIRAKAVENKVNADGDNGDANTSDANTSDAKMGDSGGNFVCDGDCTL